MMMKFKTESKVFLVAASLALSAAVAAPGEDGVHAHETASQPLTAKLTPKLRHLLIEEMKLIDRATGEILKGLVNGDHAAVAQHARQIHESFILKRELTAQDERDLAGAAPPAFLQLDGEFHSTARKLVVAAEQKDYELQRFYFGRMVESCQTCHSRYVTDRFPSFGEAQAIETEHAHGHSAEDHLH